MVVVEHPVGKWMSPAMLDSFRQPLSESAMRMRFSAAARVDSAKSGEPDSAREYHTYAATGSRGEPAAVFVHLPEGVLRAGVSLSGGTAHPNGGLGVVRRHDVAPRVQVTEGVLRAGMPLMGGATHPRHGKAAGVAPADGLRKDAAGAVAVPEGLEVEPAEVPLRFAVTVGGGEAEIGRRRLDARPRPAAVLVATNQAPEGDYRDDERQAPLVPQAGRASRRPPR